MSSLKLVQLGLVAALVVAGCETSVAVPAGSGGSSLTSTSSAGGTGASGGGGAAGGGTGASGGGAGGCVPVVCPDGKIHECGDCIDNDDDGLIDGEDPECVGACDGYSWWEIQNCPPEMQECKTAEDCGIDPDWICLSGCCA